jgi:hypothetical protein
MQSVEGEWYRWADTRARGSFWQGLGSVMTQDDDDDGAERYRKRKTVSVGVAAHKSVERAEGREAAGERESA